VGVVVLTGVGLWGTGSVLVTTRCVGVADSGGVAVRGAEANAVGVAECWVGKAVVVLTRCVPSVVTARVAEALPLRGVVAVGV
jgi:hypothetical protein